MEATSYSVVLLLLTTCSAISTLAQSFRMNDEKYFASGSRGDEIEISCQANEFPEECFFYRPDGQLVCDSAAEEEFAFYDDGYEDEECVQDDHLVHIKDPQDRCTLRIKDLDPALHHGEWKCSLSSWGERADAVVAVNPVQPVNVEFDGYWGNVQIDVGKEISNFAFTCKVSSDDSDSISRNPGELIWTVGGEEVHKSNEYRQNEFDEWTQTWNYLPDLSDNGKAVECALSQGGKKKSDSVTLSMYMFKPMDSGEPVMTQVGESAAFTQAFKLFPAPSKGDVYWVLDTPNGEVILKPGESVERFSASDLKETGTDKYEAELAVLQVALWDDTAKHKLAVRVGNSQEPRLVEAKFRIKAAAAAGGKDENNEPVPTMPPTPSQPQEPVTSLNGTAVAGSDVAKSSAGVSLYIIVGIIILVVVLCCLFYCTRWFKKRKKKQELEKADVETAAKDEEAPIIKVTKKEADKEKEANEPLLTTATIENEKEAKKEEENLARKEAELMENLEPQPTSAASFPKAPSPPPRKSSNITDEHKEIDSMAEKIRELSDEGGRDDDLGIPQEPLMVEKRIDDFRTGEDEENNSIKEPMAIEKRIDSVRCGDEEEGKTTRKSSTSTSSVEKMPEPIMEEKKIDEIRTGAVPIEPEEETQSPQNSFEESSAKEPEIVAKAAPITYTRKSTSESSDDIELPKLSSVELRKSPDSTGKIESPPISASPPRFSPPVPSSPVTSPAPAAAAPTTRTSYPPASRVVMTTQAVVPPPPTNEVSNNEKGTEDRPKDWHRNPLYHNSSKDTKASPPSPPASPASNEDEDDNRLTWQSVDDRAMTDSVKLAEEVDKIRDFVHQASSPPLSAKSDAANAEKEKSATLDRATQTPKAQKIKKKYVEGENAAAFSFDQFGSSSSSSSSWDESDKMNKLAN